MPKRLLMISGIMLVVILTAYFAEAQVRRAPQGGVDIFTFQCNDVAGTGETFFASAANAISNCFVNDAAPNTGQTRYHLLRVGFVSALTCVAASAPGSGNTWVIRYRLNSSTVTTPTCTIADTDIACSVTPDSPVSVNALDGLALSVTETGAGVDGGLIKCAVAYSY